ncbi:MAG: (d)CMP kinase, partial [Acidimicrobiales bacterium]
MRVIAIDGPAGSGKSTVARALAKHLGLKYLDTGAMYRAVAFAVLRAGGDPDDAESTTATARLVDLDIGLDRVMVDGVDATVEIRGPEVSRAVSAVAANPEVRKELVSRQREWAVRQGGGVLEGRDIGTVVFPDAELKVYLTADPE